MSKKLKPIRVFNDLFLLDVSSFIDCSVFTSRAGVASYALIGIGDGKINSACLARFTLKCSFDPDKDFVIAYLSNGNAKKSQKILIAGKKQSKKSALHRLTHEQCSPRCFCKDRPTVI